MATNPVGGVLASEISRSYNSFAGADITAVIGQYEFAELQSINYSVTREKAPVYTLGTPDPRAYSRNKRGIGGTLIWINFDRHALLNLIQQTAAFFTATPSWPASEFHSDFVTAYRGGSAISLPTLRGYATNLKCLHWK